MVKAWFLRYKLWALGAFALVLVAAAACADDPTPTPKPTETPAPPTATSVPPTATPVPLDKGFLMAPEADSKYGGVLRWGGIANSTLYDIHQTGSIANMGPQAPMYDLLVQVDPVTWEEIIPDLAEDWTVAADGLTYTFQIRDGVKFHDGADLTANDVAASFNHIIFPPEGVLSPRQSLFNTVTEVVATDDSTVEFRLSEARGFLLRAIAGGFNIIVREQTLDDNNYDLKTVIDYPGTGPFIHQDLEPGVVRRLEKNNDYWNPDLPYLDGIEAWHFNLGPATGAACLANQVDFCFGVDPGSADEALGRDDMMSAPLYPTVPLGLWINNENAPFDDARVRRAINLAIDKPALIEAVKELFFTTPGGWLLPTDPLFPDYWGEAQNMPGWRTPTEEDLAEAKQLMADAGYGDGVTGVDFLVRSGFPFSEVTTELIQDQIKRRLGIESEIRPIASGEWYGEAQQGRYDISVTGFGVTLPHVADYWTASFKTGGGYNFNNYSNPALDAIIDRAAAESDPDALQGIIDEGIAILEEDVPMIYEGSFTVFDAWWSYVKGHGTATKGGNYWEGMRNEIWWLDK